MNSFSVSLQVFFPPLISAPFYCRAHKASTSPVETQGADTLLDGSVDRVHPGARIHLLPAVCTGHETHSGSVPLSWPQNWVKGRHGSVTHWPAESRQDPMCSLETGKHSQKWDIFLKREIDESGHTIVTLLGGETLPACRSWATAASAVEQKPHEGSASQCKKKKKEKENTRRVDCNETRWFVCSVWLAVPWKLQRSSTAGRPPILSTGKRVSFTS